MKKGICLSVRLGGKGIWKRTDKIWRVALGIAMDTGPRLMPVQYEWKARPRSTTGKRPHQAGSYKLAVYSNAAPSKIVTLTFC
jgi:hypothetical protein